MRTISLTTTICGGRETRREHAFTLIELIVVMALLAALVAVSAPALSRFARQPNLAHEATRIVALTEYARTEAVSRGIPMLLWLDVPNHRLGAGPDSSFSGGATETRWLEYPQAITIELTSTSAANPARRQVELARFLPDGSLGIDSTIALFLSTTDRDEQQIVALDDLRWRYAVTSETDFLKRTNRWLETAAQTR